MKPVFLTGYMASGKTTIGKYLAEAMNLQYIDMDFFMENRYRKTISQIFADRGEEGFREIERRTLHEIAAFEDVVIATGGGTPCFFDNINVMNEAGLTVYLKASAKELAIRLRNANRNRPLVKGKSFEELCQFIENHLQERSTFYEKSTIIFDCNNVFSNENFNHSIQNLKNIILFHVEQNKIKPH